MGNTLDGSTRLYWQSGNGEMLPVGEITEVQPVPEGVTKESLGLKDCEITIEGKFEPSKHDGRTLLQILCPYEPYKRRLEKALINYLVDRGRVVHLAKHSKKFRVRRKNLHRICKIEVT